MLRNNKRNIKFYRTDYMNLNFISLTQQILILVVEIELDPDKFQIVEIPKDFLLSIINR